MTGEPLAPKLANTAAAQARGEIGSEHVRIIEKFFADLPGHIDDQTRELAEADLARVASGVGARRSFARRLTGWRCCSIRTAICPTMPNCPAALLHD